MQERADADSRTPDRDLWRWKAAWVEDLDRVAARDRWGLALMAIGWVHLAFFLGCQWLQAHGDHAGWKYLAIWILEVLTILGAVRRIAGRGWYRTSPLAGLIARVWGTFLILSFNAVSLNSLYGLDRIWFKSVLATLSAFGFMMMAYLVSLRFFWLAVQMYFTGLLVYKFPALDYLIYGLSWCMALQAMGLIVHRRRARVLGLRAWSPTTEESPGRERPQRVAGSVDRPLISTTTSSPSRSPRPPA
ncbi:MAG: hypothetical protein IRY99_16610 [Isosphaeraceae bacterium]|nr:hypothetical protein [Isosphaeraceae bacterium]